MNTQNKIHKAIVTGASSGIGKAICLLLLDKKFEIIAVARSEKKLQELKNEAPKEALITTYSCDLSERGNISKLTKEIISDHGNIDMLVNNAGVFLPGNISGEDDASYETSMKTNIDSAYYLTKDLIPNINKEGYIFNMCSTASTIGYPNGGSYCISKFALLGFTKALRLELANQIAVSAIMPGATLTNSWAGTEEPASRFMKPEDVALTIWSAWQIRKNTVVEEIVMRPHLGDF